MEIDRDRYLVRKRGANCPRNEVKPPNSEFNASVNEIGKLCPFTKQYSRGYWSKLLKNSGKKDGEICCLIGKATGMNEKYNKCGWLTNQLKVKSLSTKIKEKK